MSESYDSTPAADGFRMPAEWEPHDGCWMLWPERPDCWRLGGKPAQAEFAAVAVEIAAGGEQVTMAVSARQYDNARGVLPPGIRVVEMSSDDAWMRDVGPSFVIDGRGGRRGVDWRFNAWGGRDGGLYFPWRNDDEVARKVLEIERAGRYRAPLILEGGSIHVDGEGTVLTTEECLLNANRNPELTREQIEQHLREYLGAEKVLWLGAGTYDDETDGHVDNICCFVQPGVVALHWTDDESDPQHAISADALARLESMTDARGRPLEVHKLPMPGPLFMSQEESDGIDMVAGAKTRLPGDRLSGSYVNFYVANERVLMPLLDPRTDEEACEILAGLFPGREVVGVPTREILLGGGNIHCVTQQQPRG
jgi:agmatine deiminase